MAEIGDPDNGAVAPQIDAESPDSSLRRIAHPVGAFLTVAAVNLAVQLKTDGLIDPDGYYHIRWSQLLGQGLLHGTLPRFVWLPLTILNEHDYADHHFLF